MDLDEPGPCGGFGYPEVSQADIFVGRAPDQLGGEVQVGAEKKVDLAGPEHEFTGLVGGGLEVQVDCGEDG